MSAFDDNPFADPSVQRAAAGSGGGAHQVSAVLEDYDPFTKTTTNPPSQPAVLQASQAAPPPSYSISPPQVPSYGSNAPVNPPPYAQTNQQSMAQEDFQRRQEELERKAAELARREAELNNGAAAFSARVNNWPPLPAFIPLQPCFYQDISVDIPGEFQDTVRRLYYLWLLHAALLVANLFAGLCVLFAGLDDGSMFGLSLVYCLFFIPLSFVCWFRPAYKAFKNDSSFNFMLFFFIFFCQFCFSIVMALGIPQLGGAGLITAIVTFRGGKRTDGATGGDFFVGFIVLCLAFGFAFAALADFFILTKIHSYYRTTGASISKAQAELASTVLSNEQVRAAATQAAAAGVRNTFQPPGAGGGQPGQGPPRG